MKLSKLKDGEFAFSNVTEILYSRCKGILIKLPLYAGAEKEWSKSNYSKDSNHFVKATKAQIEIAKQTLKKENKRCLIL